MCPRKDVVPLVGHRCRHNSRVRGPKASRENRSFVRCHSPPQIIAAIVPRALLSSRLVMRAGISRKQRERNINNASSVPLRALGAQNDVWKQIVPQGHRLFRKHGYGPDMMRCQSLGSLDGCSRALAHLQRSSQVVQLSEQLECILSRRLSEGDSLSARSVVDALFGAHYATATRLAWPNFDREWMKVFVRGTKAKRSAILCICYIWRHSHSGNLLGANTRKRPPAGIVTDIERKSENVV